MAGDKSTIPRIQFYLVPTIYVIQYGVACCHLVLLWVTYVLLDMIGFLSKESKKREGAKLPKITNCKQNEQGKMCRVKLMHNLHRLRQIIRIFCSSIPSETFKITYHKSDWILRWHLLNSWERNARLSIDLEYHNS